jgi:hypothetical protein
MPVIGPLSEQPLQHLIQSFININNGLNLIFVGIATVLEGVSTLVALFGLLLSTVFVGSIYLIIYTIFIGPTKLYQSAERHRRHGAK